MTNPINTALMNLISTVHDLNREDFNVWLQYTGHCNYIEVRFCACGYKTNQDPTYLNNAHLYDRFNDGLTEDDIAQSIETLRLSLIEASENNDEELARAKVRKEAAERKQYEDLKAKFEKVEA